MEQTKLAWPLKFYDKRAYQEYKGEAHIPRNTSVVVMSPQMTSRDQTPSTNPCDLTPDKPRAGTSRKVSDTFMAVDHFLKIANLAKSTATEEEKIKYVSTSYNWMQANEVRIQPRGHVCHQCSQPGHYKRDCPDKEKVLRIRKNTGIPKSFLNEIDDPNMTGAMVTSTGTYVIPRITAQAYAEKKKSVSPAPAKKEKTPKELVCPLCKDTMSDAATIPCCGNNFCDECIRTALLDSEEHECPVCHQTQVSPDTLEANKRLRQLIENGDNSQMWSCLPTSDPAPSTSAQKDIAHVAPQAEPSPLPPAPAPRLETASKSDPPSKMHAMEQDPYSRALASFFPPGHHHHRWESHWSNDHRERRDDNRRLSSSLHLPGHHRSRDRHGSQWKRHHKEEQEHCRSHSRRHHHSRDRSPSHHKRDHREERSYSSRSRLPSLSYSPRDRSPYREHLCSASIITSSNTGDK